MPNEILNLATNLKTYFDNNTNFDTQIYDVTKDQVNLKISANPNHPFFKITIENINRDVNIEYAWEPKFAYFDNKRLDPVEIEDLQLIIEAL